MQSQIFQVLQQAKIIVSKNLQLDLNVIIKQLIHSLDIQSSYYLHKILQITIKYLIDTKQIIFICNNVNNHIKKANNIAAFLIIYQFNQQLAQSDRINWRNQYQIKSNQNFIQYFNQWAINHEGSQRKHLLYLIIRLIPAFFKERRLEPTVRQFDALLFWLALFEVEQIEEHVTVCEAIKMIKEVRINTLHDYEQKEHLMLRRVLQILGKENITKGSLYLLFDAVSIREKNIQYFCNIYETFIGDLDEKHLCNVFITLTRSGINKQILSLIDKISHLIQHNQQYFTLRFIYQSFILPIFANYFKTHKKLYEQIYQVTKFYVYGFLAHCSLGINGIQCLLSNIEFIENKNMKSKWVELAWIACKDDQMLKEVINKRIGKLGLPNINNVVVPKNTEKQKVVWTVNLRNGRKLKKYPQINSMRFRGISNRQYDCYIISTIQSLFLTEQLPRLLNKHKKQIQRLDLRLSKSFIKIFEGLKQKKEKLTVQDIKVEGPELFRISKNQEDAQEYLLALFQNLEYQLKSIPQAIKQFFTLFKIQYKNVIVCKLCQHEIPKQNEQAYIHGYRTNQSFTLAWEDFLEGYRCPHCNKYQCYMKRSIINRPTILILHIIRFANRFLNHGKIQKILGNKPIKRQIQKYGLAGFISHKGKKISCGHYVFYGKIGKQRWAIFNDNNVNQIVVGQQQEFQRQFRSQDTPYILFYRSLA